MWWSSRRIICSSRFWKRAKRPTITSCHVTKGPLVVTHFVSSVLKDFFDGDQFVGANESRLVDDAEGAVANDLGVRVRDFLRFIVAFALGGGHGGPLGRFFGYSSTKLPLSMPNSSPETLEPIFTVTGRGTVLLGICTRTTHPLCCSFYNCSIQRCHKKFVFKQF